MAAVCPPESTLVLSAYSCGNINHLDLCLQGQIGGNTLKPVRTFKRSDLCFNPSSGSVQHICYTKFIWCSIMSSTFAVNSVLLWQAGRLSGDEGELEEGTEEQRFGGQMKIKKADERREDVSLLAILSAVDIRKTVLVQLPRISQCSLFKEVRWKSCFISLCRECVCVCNQFLVPV